MQTFSLDVQLRDVIGKKVKQLRRQGMLPATIYGKSFNPVSVQLDDRTFNNTYRKAGRTALIELNIPGQRKQSAFIHAVQRHPVSRNIIHADFRVVNLREKLHVEVPVLLIGESPLVARGDAVYNQTLTTIEINALPAEMPQHIEVDVSILDRVDKTIHVRDLPLDEHYEYITEGDELIVALSQTRASLAAEDEKTDDKVSEPAEPQLIREDRESRDEE